MKNCLTILLLMLCSLSQAQSLLDSNRMLYQNLLNQKPPGNTLIDILPYSDLIKEHRGADSDSNSSPQRYDLVYEQLRACNANPQGIPSLDSIHRIISGYRNNGLVPISVIAAEYGRLIDTSSRALSFQASNYLLKLNIPIDSVVEKQLAFLFAIHSQTGSFKPKVIFPSSLFYSSLNNYSLKADFGDGLGMRQIQLDQVISLDYSGLGLDSSALIVLPVDLKLELPSGTLKSNGLYHYFPEAYPDRRFKASSIEITEDCMGLKASELAEARISIRYGKNNAADRVLRKPLILVEGFDFDANPGDERYGDINYTSIVKGFSFSEITGQRTKQNLKDMEVFAEKIYNESFDLIFINFKDGSADLRKNGNTLIRLIQWVNQNKASDEEVVVIGASMGGILARYAIRTMELADCKHCIKLYASFDSPHQGANISMALQYAIEFMTKNSLDTKFAMQALASVGAQQLLLNNVVSGSDQIRKEWQNWLNTNGHPVYPRRIAITNGDPLGSKPFNKGDLLYNVCYKKSGIKILEMSLYSGKPDKQAIILRLPKGQTSLGQWVNGLFGKKTYLLRKFPSGSVHFDHASGGQSPWIGVADQLVQELVSENELKSCDTKVLTNGGNITFIPTFSSLDLNTTYTAPNLKSLFPDQDASSNQHPFDAIFYHSRLSGPQSGNQSHVYVDAAPNQNIDWLMEQLAYTSHELEAILPNSAGYTNYNYNDESRSLTVPGIWIQPDGRLVLNGNERTKYGRTSDPMPAHQGDVKVFHSLQCGAFIKLEGKLELGEQSTTVPNKAVFHLSSGSVLSIESGGELIINEGSTLIIEEGAQLIYHPGARILLNGPNSSLQIKGTLFLEDQSLLNTYSYSSQIGILELFATPSNGKEPIQALGTASLDFQGTYAIHEPRVKIHGRITLAQDFESANFEYANIYVVDGGWINVQCPFKFLHSKVSGSSLPNAGSGFKIDGTIQAEISGSHFYGLLNGLELNPPNVQAFDLNHCVFEQCTEGLAVYRDGVRLNSTHFTHCGTGIQTFADGVLSMESCISKFNDLGISLMSNNGLVLKAVNCDFNSNQLAISSLDQNSIGMLCCRFQHNELALQLNTTELIMTDQNPHGWICGQNSFNGNLSCIEGHGHIYLDEGNNNFIKSPSNALPIIKIETPASSPTLNSASELEANNNFWSPIPPNPDLRFAGLNYYDLSIITSLKPIHALMSGMVLASLNSSCFTIPPDWDIPNGHSDQALASISDAQTQNIRVYPIPSSGVVKIENYPFTSSELSIDIQTKDGKSMPCSWTIDNNLIVVDLSNLAAGVYTINLKSAEDLRYYKLIKVD